MSTWAQGANKFAELGARIQTERSHKVVDTGPYALVRHPLYVGAFFLYGSISLTEQAAWQRGSLARIGRFRDFSAAGRRQWM